MLKVKPFCIAKKLFLEAKKKAQWISVWRHSWSETFQSFGETCFGRLEWIPGGCGPELGIVVEVGLQGNNGAVMRKSAQGIMGRVVPGFEKSRTFFTDLPPRIL